MNDQSESNNKTSVKCLECHANIGVEPDAMEGEVITCPECSTDLEIVSVTPVKLALAPTAQEDWGQ